MLRRHYSGNTDAWINHSTEELVKRVILNLISYTFGNIHLFTVFDVFIRKVFRELFDGIDITLLLHGMRSPDLLPSDEAITFGQSGTLCRFCIGPSGFSLSNLWDECQIETAAMMAMLPPLAPTRLFAHVRAFAPVNAASVERISAYSRRGSSFSSSSIDYSVCMASSRSYKIVSHRRV